MKRIFKILTAAAFCIYPAEEMTAAVVQTDPALTGAIVIQTYTLKDIYENRSKKHNEILVAQGIITAGVEQIHNLEDKMLEYLSNASGVLQNMYQIKRIGELIVEIPGNLMKLGKDVPDNIKGTAITLFANKTATETYADITSMAATIEKLVTSHYSFKDNKDDKNINLLSAAERYAILQSIYKRLDDINWRLRLTRYYIKTFGWQQLWRGIDRESWCKVMYSKMMVKNLVNKWNSL